jgi:histidine triad (HIT) family protein
LAEKDCPFCKIIAHAAPAAIVCEDEETLAFMDLYPATAGHMLVLPKRHIENIYAMPEELGARIMAMAVALAKAAKHQLSATGLNLVQSNGADAGQTISHFHLHIVPRYSGDPVALKFGHSATPANLDELERLASLLRSAL